MKISKKVHLWMAVPFGLIITIISFSGAMLVFEPEITRMVQHDRYYVKNIIAESDSISRVPLTPEAVCEIVGNEIPDSVEMTSIKIDSDPNRSWEISLSYPKKSSIFVNQYNGEILGRSERLPFFTTMFKLHRWLLDSPSPNNGGIIAGRLIVGISTIAFAIVLISGLLVWIPRARRNFSRNIKLILNKGKFPFWMSLHAAGGIYVLIFLLTMALTGLTWSFDWYKSAFYTICGESARNEKQIEVKINGHQSQKTELSIPVKMVTNGGPCGREIVCGDGSFCQECEENPANQKRISVPPIVRSGEKQELPFQRKIYNVHTGYWGGLPTRILWFFAALFGASLPLTGYYLWLKRIKVSFPKKR